MAALIAYMRSVPEVQQESYENRIGLLAKVLTVFGQMPLMFPAFEIDQNKGFNDKPEEAPTPEFGQYLASACVGCHRTDFSGGKIPGGDPAWPEASDARLGRDPFWTEEKFRQMVATGISAKTGQPLRHPMPVHLLRQLNETEIKALWLFLASLK